MKLSDLLSVLQQQPESAQFSECIQTIDDNYTFSPTSFINGNQHNEAGQNNGSCKIFAFGLLNKLTKQQTLACFGEYYRNDVLNNPDARDHQNIRQFMLNGWPGIKFSDQPLTVKQT